MMERWTCCLTLTPSSSLKSCCHFDVFEVHWKVVALLMFLKSIERFVAISMFFQSIERLSPFQYIFSWLSKCCFFALLLYSSACWCFQPFLHFNIWFLFPPFPFCFCVWYKCSSSLLLFHFIFWVLFLCLVHFLSNKNKFLSFSFC